MEKKFLQRGLREFGGAPDLARAPIIVEILGAERPAAANLVEQVIGEDFFAWHQAAGPGAAAEGPAVHRAEEVRPRVERKRHEDAGARHVMLEGRAGRGELRNGIGRAAMQLSREIALAITGDAVAQNQINADASLCCPSTSWKSGQKGALFLRIGGH